jgi:hypothetical protein
MHCDSFRLPSWAAAVLKLQAQRSRNGVATLNETLQFMARTQLPECMLLNTLEAVVDTARELEIQMNLAY